MFTCSARSVVGFFLASLAVLSFGGCANERGGVVAYDQPNFGQPDAATPAVIDDGRIGPQDVVSVSVFQLPDLNREAQVDNAGNITLPLIGQMKAQGLTPAEVGQEITTRLAARYVRKPDVQVVIKQSGAQTITVEGAVASPGVFPISGQVTLLKAVALAKGTTEAANPRRIVIFRTINGQRNAAAFDLQSIRRAEMNDPIVYGNDIIVVDGSTSRSRFKDIVQTLPLVALFRPF